MSKRNRQNKAVGAKQDKKTLLNCEGFDVCSDHHNSNFYHRANFVLPIDNIKEPDSRQLEQSTIDYIPFLNTNNGLLNELYSIINTSPTTRAIIKNKTTLSSGAGFYATEGRTSSISNIEKPQTASAKNLLELDDYINDITGDGRSLQEELEKVFFDMWSYGNAFIELRKSRVNGASYLTVHHVAIEYCRPKKVSEYSETNKVEYIGISNRFEDGEQDPTNVVDVPVYPNFENVAGIERSIIHIKDYSPQFFYWGLPDWIASVIWGEMEYRSAKFNQSKFDNGYVPSAIVTMAADMNSDEAGQFIKKFQEKFTGTGNNSKMFVQVVRDMDAKADVQILENHNEGEFLNLVEITTDKIITAHRWTPSLAGIKTAGQLGSNQQIRLEYEIILNTVIKPVQKMIERRLIAPILKESAAYNDGANWQNIALHLQCMNIVSFMSTLDASAVMTENEQREELGLPPLENDQNIEADANDIN